MNELVVHLMQLKNGHTKGENMRSISILFPLLLLACTEKENDTSNQESPEQALWQTEDGTTTGEGKEDYDDEEKEDYDDEEKEDYSEEEKEDSSFDDCPVDFDSTASCSGSWEETICVSDNQIWWCQDGVWMNESEKED